MLQAVLSGFVLAMAAPWLHRIGGRWAGWIMALLPAGLFIYFFSWTYLVAQGGAAVVSYAWVPSLGVNLSFYVDGLSLLFALIISGIGALIVIYGGGYLKGDSDIGRFYLYLLMFMASMLGVVLSNNVITLFVFWELTSITSYLLIGYYHDAAESRAAALQALLVTGGGGLALLAGVVLLGWIGGSWEFSELLLQGELIRSHALYLPILLLILAAAFTKSAQFPFHFWLPNAMAAPTPVSAYLHSATMVKAGVYLLARASPMLSGTGGWFYLVTGFGMVTMLLAAYIAWQQLDLKRILAYSTVSALGTLVMLLGLGTETAVSAAIIFLLVHSLYKGALFMAAGAIDHETGTRSVAELGGLRRAMPITATAAGLAALSMAGIPPFIGFISKELIYEAALHAEGAAMIYLLVSAGVTANALMIVAAGLVAAKPFFGPRIETPKHAHEAPPAMWLGPAILAGLGLLIGLSQVIAAASPIHVDQLILTPAVRSILAGAAELHLVLWHGLNTALALSIVTLILGFAFYSGINSIRRRFEPLNMIARWGPERWYLWLMDGLMVVARRQTRLLQSGYLRYYLAITILTTVGIASYTLVSQGGPAASHFIRPPRSNMYEVIIYLVILVAALVIISTSSRLAAVASLGVVGYGVSLIFILFGAPDLAMTQFSIETLSVILLVLVLYKLPRFTRFSRPQSRAWDFVVALAGGGLMTLLVLIVTALPSQSRLTPYFAENSYLLAQGHNVVNVILVDFRGFDTMGEITVLGVAALGVFSLLYLRLDRSRAAALEKKPAAVEPQTPEPEPVVEYDR